MADKQLIEKMIIAEEQAIDSFGEQLDSYSNIDDDMLDGLVTLIRKYDVAKIAGSLRFAEARIKTTLDKQTIDIETLKEWSQLNDSDKTKPEEIAGYLEAIKSLRKTTKLLKAMTSFLMKLNDMAPDIEVIMGEMMGEVE